MNRCEKLNPRLLEVLTEQEVKFFDAYLGSPQAVDHAIEIHEQSRLSKENLRPLYSLIQGAVFQNVTYSYLLKSYITSPNQRLLSTKEATILYSVCTGKEIFTNRGISEGIEGITVPNAILLERKRKYWQIMAIFAIQSGNGFKQDFELTSFYKNATIATIADFGLDKPDGKQEFGDLINSIFPDIDPLPVELDPKNFRVIEVVPEYSHSQPPYEQIRVPITRKGFFLFLDSMINRCSETDPAIDKKLTTADLVKFAQTVRLLNPPVMQEIFGK